MSTSLILSNLIKTFPLKKIDKDFINIINNETQPIRKRLKESITMNIRCLKSRKKNTRPVSIYTLYFNL